MDVEVREVVDVEEAWRPATWFDFFFTPVTCTALSNYVRLHHDQVLSKENLLSRFQNTIRGSKYTRNTKSSITCARV